MNEQANLAAALVAALADVTVVEKGRTAKIKTKTGADYQYDYADIADVVRLTRAKLAEHGVIALTPIHGHSDGLACTVILLHTSGERMDLGPFPFPHGADAQSTGSMVTYHRRYALVSALGMAAGDDDDGAAAKPRQKQQAAPAAPPAPRPISAENLASFLQKCADNGLDADDIAAVVHDATEGRTSKPEEVLTSEVKALRDAFSAFAGSKKDEVPA